MGAVVDVEFDDMEGVPDILNALHVKVSCGQAPHFVADRHPPLHALFARPPSPRHLFVM